MGWHSTFDVRARGPIRFINVALLGAVGIVFPTCASTAIKAPEALIQGRTNIAAHVIGEVPGTRCQIAGQKVSGPWGTVDTDGSVTLVLRSTHASINQLRVICEDLRRGDASVHTVRSRWLTYSDVLAPTRRIDGK
ncbi:hypothetical protein [Nocardia sp. NPDC004722]